MPRRKVRPPAGHPEVPLGLLSPRAVYALRAMAVLANIPPGESLRSDELAERAAIPSAFVSKVMRRLVAGGLVEGRRGHGGGFRLARAPARITFGEILAAVGFSVDPRQCVFGFGECDKLNPCVLHDTWQALKEALTAWANGATLADVRG